MVKALRLSGMGVSVGRDAGAGAGGGFEEGPCSRPIPAESMSSMTTMHLRGKPRNKRWSPAILGQRTFPDMKCCHYLPPSLISPVARLMWYISQPR